MSASDDVLKKMVPSCEAAPHRSVIWIEAEVHEITKYGECSGRPVYRIESFPVYLDGGDKYLAIRGLNELLAELKKRCPAK